MGDKRAGRLIRVAAATAAAGIGLVGCHSGSPAHSGADGAYLAEIQGAAPDIGGYRSNTELIRLGHVVCDDFGAKATYEEVADRLALEQGSNALPSQDLGAVITAAADNYCPQYRSRVS